MELLTSINTSIPYGLWIVYLRLPDGRIWYFRGKRPHRKQLFVSDFGSGPGQSWTPVPETARLFQKEPQLTEHTITSRLRTDYRARHISYQGFAGTVLTTHLIIPRG